jgi:hypothetical protein
MANYLCIHPAPDSHIDFIRRHPDTVWAYIEGERPEPAPQDAKQPGFWRRLMGSAPSSPPPTDVPDDWPVGERLPIGPEINHRNVDLYHLILNGTTEFVDGSGSIFQTWLTNDQHSAIDLTGDHEHFAFKSGQIPAFVELLEAVDAAAVKARFTQWLRAAGDDYDPSDEECEEIAREFRDFAAAARDAVAKSQGLIWVSR